MCMWADSHHNHPSYLPSCVGVLPLLNYSPLIIIIIYATHSPPLSLLLLVYDFNPIQGTKPTNVNWTAGLNESKYQQRALIVRFPSFFAAASPVFDDDGNSNNQPATSLLLPQLVEGLHIDSNQASSSSTAAQPPSQQLSASPPPAPQEPISSESSLPLSSSSPITNKSAPDTSSTSNTSPSSPQTPQAATGVLGIESQDKEGEGGLKGVIKKVVTYKDDLNSSTSQTTKQLETAAPPPFMDDLQSAVQRVRETDFTPLWTVLKRVFGDLGEGFQGLGKSAREFELQGAVEGLRQKFDRELALRAPGGAGGVSVSASANGGKSSSSSSSNESSDNNNSSSSSTGSETNTNSATSNGNSDAIATPRGGEDAAKIDATTTPTS